MLIDEFVHAEVSATKSTKERRIDELLQKLAEGDVLLVAELSRLGRNMLQTLNIINELSERGVKITFVRQPELSTTGPHGKLLLAIYSYFAETERAYISLRTKQGLAAAKAKGKQLGRPKGSPTITSSASATIQFRTKMGDTQITAIYLTIRTLFCIMSFTDISIGDIYGRYSFTIAPPRTHVLHAAQPFARPQTWLRYLERG